MPVLKNFQKKYGNQGLVVVGVNVDDEAKSGIAFAEKNKVDFKLLFDEGKKLIKEAGVSTMPSSFMVDSKGKIVYIHKGFRMGDDKVYEKEILAHLGKK
jgi:peroxiredoxin